MPKVNLKVPHRSGFNKSFHNMLTSKCGTLTPILCDEVIPSQKINLKQVISASLPPLASDTFMKCDLKVEAFFVPTRLLYGGYENWLTKQPTYNPDDSDYTNNVSIPVLSITANDANYVNPGTLADFLGLRVRTVHQNDWVGTYNIFPFLAYHRIYDDWYRNTLCQSPVFFKPTNYGGTPPGALPYSCIIGDPQFFSISETFADGVSFGSLRQRNFGYDYFTLAMPEAQLGDALSVSTQLRDSFTISALRAANSLQQFAERNQLAGLRYQDYIRANYGASLSDGVAQRALLLGSGTIPVYSKGVYSNSNMMDDPAGETATKNPFENSVGAEYGSVSCNGQLDLVDDFTANEPGYLMVLASLVPTVSYATGIERMLLRYTASGSQTDMANPILQNVGMQPIYMAELNGARNAVGDGRIFGYSDRYADFKHCNDQIHGLLRDGQSLQSFALQRAIVGNVTVSSSTFLPIPTDYLDQVASVAGTISQYGIWIDCFNDYRVSMPLAEYALPSLQDPAYEHGVDVPVEIGGSRL